jgi:hypothetical protein
MACFMGRPANARTSAGARPQRHVRMARLTLASARLIVLLDLDRLRRSSIGAGVAGVVSPLLM